MPETFTIQKRNCKLAKENKCNNQSQSCLKPFSLYLIFNLHVVLTFDSIHFRNGLLLEKSFGTCTAYSSRYNICFRSITYLLKLREQSRQLLSRITRGLDNLWFLLIYSLCHSRSLNISLPSKSKQAQHLEGITSSENGATACSAVF